MNRELDIKVAEAKGWKDFIGKGENVWGKPPEDPESIYDTAIPEFSSDLNAAWSLVPEGLDLRIFRATMSSGQKITKAYLIDHGVASFSASEVGHTPQAAAEAICKAFLQWGEREGK